MEPPGPHLHGGQAALPLTRRRRRRKPGQAALIAEIRWGAAAAASVLVVTGRGDAFLLAAVLALAAFDRRAVAITGAVAVALLARWGTSSLAAIGGAQAVLGPALVVGPLAGAAAVVLAAVALVLMAPGGLMAAAFGAAAGWALAGPSWATVPGALVRVAALAGGAAGTWWLQPRLPARAREAAPAVAAAAFVAGVLA